MNRIDVLSLVAIALTLGSIPTSASAQVQLSQPAGRLVASGVSAGERLGTRLDRGDVNGDINNKDLVIASPEWSAGRGRVHILFGWLNRDADFDISVADVRLTGSTAGDRFGQGTSLGFVTTLENPVPSRQTTARDLVIGAPGAFGGKGAAYLFVAPLSPGTLTPADAAVTIIGRAGDQLGLALETADVNGDGYREVIAGAPGNNRVYIIDVRNRAGNTIDFSTTPPLSILSAPGVGSVFHTGDVTGDGIFDVAIGAPTANSGAGAVYLMAGRSSSAAWPATIDLATGASASFAGPHVGALAGSALWIADFDGDALFDLIIGAPAATGLGRAEAGQVYVIWGGANATAGRGLTGANLTFTGAAPGHRLGASVSMGEVTQHLSSDLAMLATGASGKGEIYVYYGRARGAFPTSVDVGAGVDRRIIADPAGSALEQVIVWEVLGKGSESIVASAPSETTAAGAAAGKLYFSLSPTLELESSQLSMHAIFGRSSPRTVKIVNRGATSAPWSARTNVPWLIINSATGSAANGAPGLLTYSLSPTLSPGKYRASIFVDPASADLNGGRQLLVDVIVTFLSTTRLADFDGDGKDDSALFRPSTSRWVTISTTTGMQSTPAWGTGGDIPAPGDFNGDGRVERAVFRPATGVWHIENVTPTPWGAAGDVPVPADYDGDGKTDLAVFRPSTGMWYVFGQFSRQYGNLGDIPVPGDYLGLGYAQLAVFRGGTWWIAGHGAIPWGNVGDIPVPADYNGDGRTDPTVFRPVNGTWYARGLFGFAWGTLGDIPMAQDADGDGRSELVVYRPSAGAFFSYNRISGSARQWLQGTVGDFPVPRAVFQRAAKADYDGDRRADLTVWRGSTSQWLLLGSSAAYDGTQNISITWGDRSQDVAINGDYDGDGKLDIGVWRPSTGQWFILQSTANYATQASITVAWGSGAPGYLDVPVPADYDNDGKTDIAVWRSRTGEWFIKRSTLGTLYLRWGAGAAPYNDQPVVADYDGDGLMDIGVWRPGEGTWYLLLSSASYDPGRATSVNWGSGVAPSNDIPVPADYDGDGKADIAVWRPPTGMWYIRRSSAPGTIDAVAWGSGGTGDVSVPSDYDGDGRTDLAVWTPATGNWSVLLSSRGYSKANPLTQQWGSGAPGTADRPVVPRH